MMLQASYSVAPIMLSFAVKSEDQQHLLIFCFGYIALNFLPYFFAYGSSVFLNVWKLRARSQIAKDIQNQYEKKYNLLNMPGLEKKYKAILSNNSQEIIINIIEYI